MADPNPWRRTCAELPPPETLVECLDDESRNVFIGWWDCEWYEGDEQLLPPPDAWRPIQGEYDG